MSKENNEESIVKNKLRFPQYTYISIILISIIVCISIVLAVVYLPINNALAANSYTITYNPNGGTLSGNSSISATEGSTITLPNVEKVGYSAKWVDNPTWNTGSVSGTAISTRSQLASISGSGSYYLKNDIDLSGSNWTPISSFSGTLDGRGYAIKNMKISGTMQYAGLFSTLNGTVRNLQMTGVSISVSYSSSNSYYGPIAAQSSSGCTITNCETSGNLTYSSSSSSDNVRVGGIIGGLLGRSNISYCTNNTNIVLNNRNYTWGGGITGIMDNSSSSISNSINNGSLTMTGSSSGNRGLGGFVGINAVSSCSFTNVYNLKSIKNTGSVGSNSRLGGIIGWNDYTANLNNCFNSGAITGGYVNYQIYGVEASSSMTNCYYLSGTSGTAQGTAVSGVSNLATKFYDNISSTDKGTAQGTAVSGVSNLATKFYDNISSTDKPYWYKPSNTYPVLWYDAPDFSGNIGDSKYVGYGYNHNLTAQYTANTYTIVFNGNGATNTMANKSVTFGTGTKITSSFVLSGFDFAGWATSASAREPQYSNGFNFDTFPAGANNNGASFTLYAVWKSTLNLDQQGGSGGTTSVTGTRNLSMNSATAPTRTGWTFGGYYTQEGGKGTQYYNSSMGSTHLHDLGNGTTLYAFWQSTVNLDQQGGSGGTTSISGTYNQPMPTAYAPARNGYTFDGYWTGRGGSGTQYYNGDMVSTHTYDLASGTTLYAKWTCGTVVLDSQGGTGGSANVVPVYNAPMPTAIAPTRTGWTFGGYYTQEGGRGTQYYTASMTSAKDWTEATNITLYAKWTTTIALNMDGGSGGTSSIVVTYNAPMPDATAPTRTGYTFGGYYTESNGNGTRFYTEDMTSAQDWNLAVNTSLYAKWVAREYVVTFEYNGATDGNTIENKKVSFGNFYSDLPSPSKAGSSFAGWYLESTFQTPITSTTVVSTASDHTIYAKWSTWLILHVSGTSNSVSSISEINALYTNATVDIYPATGQYVSSISFDNVNYYTISYTEYTFANLSFALKASYYASIYSNVLGLDFEHIFRNYFDNNEAIHVYLVMQDTPYERLITSSGGTSVQGVAVGATFGGTAYISGYDYDNMSDEDTVTLVAKVTQNDYRFVGWFAADNMGLCLSTEISATLKKSIVYERQIIAKFEKIEANPNMNDDMNNP